MEILIKVKGKYSWKFKYGESYNLGFHHGRVVGMRMLDAEEVNATYFGFDGQKHLFYREKSGKVLKYSTQNKKTLWMSDGDDEESKPYVQARFDGELPLNNRVSQSILEDLVKMKQEPIKSI